MMIFIEIKSQCQNLKQQKKIVSFFFSKLQSPIFCKSQQQQQQPLNSLTYFANFLLIYSYFFYFHDLNGFVRLSMKGPHVWKWDKRLKLLYRRKKNGKQKKNWLVYYLILFHGPHWLACCFGLHLQWKLFHIN